MSHCLIVRHFTSQRSSMDGSRGDKSGIDSSSSNSSTTVVLKGFNLQQLTTLLRIYTAAPHVGAAHLMLNHCSSSGSAENPKDTGGTNVYGFHNKGGLNNPSLFVMNT